MLWRMMVDVGGKSAGIDDSGIVDGRWLARSSTVNFKYEGTIKMEYKGEPLPEKIPWEGEFTLRSDP